MVRARTSNVKALSSADRTFASSLRACEELSRVVRRGRTRASGSRGSSPADRRSLLTRPYLRAAYEFSAVLPEVRRGTSQVALLSRGGLRRCATVRLAVL